MKVISYTALHYGRDYLASAIRSVIDSVDEHHVLYTAIGSHGSRTSIPCPETRDELYAIAEAAAGSKLRWHDGEWPYEGAQRDSIHQYAPDADVILVVDADEVWSTGLADEVLSTLGNQRRYRLPIIHYWRSFYRAVLHDPAFPERVIVPNSFSGGIGAFDKRDGVIHHFGYAQRPEIVEYKILTHGHRGEWRHDVDWFHDKFMANAQTDCHPVGSDHWNPETVDPYSLGLPEFMREHEYAGMEVIGEVI
jgi:hypothetical protein